MAALAVSQSTEPTTPSLTTTISRPLITATTTTTLFAPKPTSSSGTDIPKPSVEGNSSIQSTFPKAGDYFASRYYPETSINGHTAVVTVHYDASFTAPWVAAWTWPSDQPKQNISVFLCSTTRCFQNLFWKGNDQPRAVSPSNWIPDDEMRKANRFKDWPKDSYFTYLPSTFEMPITPSDEKYFVQMTNDQINGTVLAVSDYFTLNLTDTLSPNYPKINGGIALHAPSAAALVALIVGAFLVV